MLEDESMRDRKDRIRTESDRTDASAVGEIAIDPLRHLAPASETPVPADLARADRLTGVRGRRPWAKRGRKAGDVSIRMSVASCRASQFAPPVRFSVRDPWG